ncbi:MAG TPA: hypothetical protein VN088_08520 [Nocardioides sp.]|nr:hypothetical protein [Nocardioides sp.]
MTAALPHVQAVLDLLNGAGVTAYLGKRGDVTPCVVLYPDAGTAESSSLTPNEDLVVYIPLHAVGAGPEQALWVMDKARAALTFAQPAVTGRYVHPMWQEQGPTPLQRDDDVQPPLFTSFAEFGIRSQPA